MGSDIPEKSYERKREESRIRERWREKGQKRGERGGGGERTEDRQVSRDRGETEREGTRVNENETRERGDTERERITTNIEVQLVCFLFANEIVTQVVENVDFDWSAWFGWTKIKRTPVHSILFQPNGHSVFDITSKTNWRSFFSFSPHLIRHNYTYTYVWYVCM